MSLHSLPKANGSPPSGPDAEFMTTYLDALTLVERLHRLLLDVIKDEFERVGVLEINAVQALLLFNIGDNEVTATGLQSKGVLDMDRLDEIAAALRRVERYWTDQIRYIY